METKKEINKKRSYIFILTFLFLVFGAFLDVFSTHLISENFSEELVLAPDLFFKFFEFNDLSKINEIFRVISIVLLFYFVFKYKDKSELPYLFLLFGAFQFVRAFSILLTPLMPPYFPYHFEFGLFSKFLPNVGLFPSGHTSYAFMGFLISWNKKFYRYSFLILFLIIALTMLISRGHYSIDILGTVFICYAIFVFMERNIKEKLKRLWGEK